MAAKVTCFSFLTFKITFYHMIGIYIKQLKVFVCVCDSKYSGLYPYLIDS